MVNMKKCFFAALLVLLMIFSSCEAGDEATVQALAETKETLAEKNAEISILAAKVAELERELLSVKEARDAALASAETAVAQAQQQEEGPETVSTSLPSKKDEVYDRNVVLVELVLELGQTPEFFDRALSGFAYEESTMIDGFLGKERYNRHYEELGLFLSFIEGELRTYQSNRRGLNPHIPIQVGDNGSEVLDFLNNNYELIVSPHGNTLYNWFNLDSGSTLVVYFDEEATDRFPDASDLDGEITGMRLTNEPRP